MLLNSLLFLRRNRVGEANVRRSNGWARDRLHRDRISSKQTKMWRIYCWRGDCGVCNFISTSDFLHTLTIKCIFQEHSIAASGRAPGNLFLQRTSGADAKRRHECRNGAANWLHHRDISTELGTVWRVLRFRADSPRVWWLMTHQEILLLSTDETSRRYFPKGGGVCRVVTKPIHQLSAIRLLDFGEVEKFFGWSFVSGTLPIKVRMDSFSHCTCFEIQFNLSWPAKWKLERKMWFNRNHGTNQFKSSAIKKIQKWHATTALG